MDPPMALNPGIEDDSHSISTDPISERSKGLGVQVSPLSIDISSINPQAIERRNQIHSVSISMPSSPTAPCTDHNCYDPFKTFSYRFERQISSLRGSLQEIHEIPGSGAAEPAAVPTADRYFAALEGPELESLKPSEKLVLPREETWPFLLRFTISSFGVSLGIGIQALLWKTVATSPSMEFLHLRLVLSYVLWCASVSLLIPAAFIYGLKMVLYFEAVKREYHHPIRVNFFFAPWIGCIILAVSVPPSIQRHLPDALWYALMAPILCLELKIYGQWMLGGERRLSKVANPTNHLSILGNFAGSLLASTMGLKEGAAFFFAIGLAHYIVLFVTLYQRLPTNETLPKDLHPVFFLFIAGPSLACLSWTMLVGRFDLGSRIAYFMAMFLYASLIVRVNFFRGFRYVTYTQTLSAHVRSGGRWFGTPVPESGPEVQGRQGQYLEQARRLVVSAPVQNYSVAELASLLSSVSRDRNPHVPIFVIKSWVEPAGLHLDGSNLHLFGRAEPVLVAPNPSITKHKRSKKLNQHRRKYTAYGKTERGEKNKGFQLLGGLTRCL